jgi:hypothetical protein
MDMGSLIVTHKEYGIVGGLNNSLLNPRIFVFYVTCACNPNTFETLL